MQPPNHAGDRSGKTLYHIVFDALLLLQRRMESLHEREAGRSRDMQKSLIVQRFSGLPPDQGNPSGPDLLKIFTNKGGK